MPEDNSREEPFNKMDSGYNEKKDLEKEMEAPAEKDTSDNKDKGDSELKSKDEIETEETPNGYQYLNKNSSGEKQDSITGVLRAEESNDDSSSQSQPINKGIMQEEGSDTSSSKPQLTEKEELEQWKELVDPELKALKYAASLEDINQKEQRFRQFLNAKVNENGFINEGVWKLLDSYIEDLLETWRYHALVRGNRTQSSS